MFEITKYYYEQLKIANKYCKGRSYLLTQLNDMGTNKKERCQCLVELRAYIKRQLACSLALSAILAILTAALGVLFNVDIYDALNLSSDLIFVVTIFGMILIILCCVALIYEIWDYPRNTYILSIVESVLEDEKNSEKQNSKTSVDK